MWPSHHRAFSRARCGSASSSDTGGNGILSGLLITLKLSSASNIASGTSRGEPPSSDSITAWADTASTARVCPVNRTRSPTPIEAGLDSLRIWLSSLRVPGRGRSSGPCSWLSCPGPPAISSGACTTVPLLSKAPPRSARSAPVQSRWNSTGKTRRTSPASSAPARSRRGCRKMPIKSSATSASRPHRRCR